MGVSSWTSPSKKGMTCVDMFKTLVMDSIKKVLEGNADIAVIPGGLTSQLQPLDVSIYKNKVRILWTEWMAGSTDHVLTREGLCYTVV